MATDNSEKKKGVDTYLKMPLLGGAVIGFAAALIQALLFAAGGPQAYGFCVACHSCDLINYVTNSLTGSNLFLATFSGNAGAAVLYKEFRVKKGDAKSYLTYGIGGMNSFHDLRPLHGSMPVPATEISSQSSDSLHSSSVSSSASKLHSRKWRQNNG